MSEIETKSDKKLKKLIKLRSINKNRAKNPAGRSSGGKNWEADISKSLVRANERKIIKNIEKGLSPEEIRSRKKYLKTIGKKRKK